MKSNREDLRNERIEWLTRAVRALMKMEFEGDKYYQMEVGRQDVELTAREKAYKDAAKAVDAFMKAPTAEEALKKLYEIPPTEEP
jgi:hypothetical protein